MKKYRLKKDFVFSKTGEKFEISLNRGGKEIGLYKDGVKFYNFCLSTINEDIKELFNELFEEVGQKGEHMQKKTYRLLKDLPFAKAGETFGLHRGGIKDCITLFKGDKAVYTIRVGENVSEMFDEWFEEIKEPEEYFIINFLHLIITKTSTDFFAEWVIENLKSLGLLFRTREEAEKYLKYLKAKTIIKQDAKGFKPDWEDEEQPKYYGFWNFKEHEPEWSVNYITKIANIYFKSYEALEESFEKHPKEWKTYLTYEQ